MNLSNFVFCQYTFWDQCESTVAAPVVDPDVPSPLTKDVQFTVTFAHCKVILFGWNARKIHLSPYFIYTHTHTHDSILLYSEMEMKQGVLIPALNNNKNSFPLLSSASPTNYLQSIPLTFSADHQVLHTHSGPQFWNPGIG